MRGGRAVQGCAARALGQGGRSSGRQPGMPRRQQSCSRQPGALPCRAAAGGAPVDVLGCEVLLKLSLAPHNDCAHKTRVHVGHLVCAHRTKRRRARRGRERRAAARRQAGEEACPGRQAVQGRVRCGSARPALLPRCAAVRHAPLPPPHTLRRLTVVAVDHPDEGGGVGGAWPRRLSDTPGVQVRAVGWHAVVGGVGACGACMMGWPGAEEGAGAVGGRGGPGAAGCPAGKGGSR